MATCSALTPNLNLHKPGEHHLYHPGDSLRPCLILVWYPKTHSAVEPYGKPAGSLRPGGTLCLLLRCLRPVLEAVSLSSPCGLSHIPPSPAQIKRKNMKVNYKKDRMRKSDIRLMRVLERTNENRSEAIFNGFGLKFFHNW